MALLVRSILATLLLISQGSISFGFQFFPRSKDTGTTLGPPPARTSLQSNMQWNDLWDDIIQGGNQRWKVTDEAAHKAALGHMQRHMKKPGSHNILCPLCGDDPMVQILYRQGHSVTAMDIVPAALAQMRDQFEGTWTKEEKADSNLVIWRHESGRAVQYQGDALQSIPELKETFDCIYDKDSFGALPRDMREAFCKRMGEYAKPGAVVYLECVLKDDHEESKGVGPPFSLRKEELMDETCYGKSFEYVEGLGSVYPTGFDGMQQTGHVMNRL